MTKEKKLEKKFIKNCENIIKNKGDCTKLLCRNCPGSLINHPLKISCMLNGWSSKHSMTLQEILSNRIKSAKEWLLNNQNTL